MAGAKQAWNDLKRLLVLGAAQKKVFKKVTNRLSRACPAYELKCLKFHTNFSTWKLLLAPKNEEKNVNWYQPIIHKTQLLFLTQKQ